MSAESSTSGERRVLILAHTGREEASKVAAEFAQAMAAEGIAVRVVERGRGGAGALGPS